MNQEAADTQAHLRALRNLEGWGAPLEDVPGAPIPRGLPESVALADHLSLAAPIEVRAPAELSLAPSVPTATFTPADVHHPFSARRDVVARFLDAVRVDAGIFRDAYEATGEQRFLAPIEELKRRSAAEALRALRLLSGETLAPAQESPAEVTQPDIAPPIRVRENVASTRGLRRLFARFRPRRRRS